MARKFAIGLLAMALALSALVVGCGNGIGTGAGVDGEGAGGNEQRLVGRWANLHGGTTAVFNSDGTMSGFPTITGTVAVAGRGSTLLPTHWAAAGDWIIMYSSYNRGSGSFGFRISSDGQTLIIGNRAFRRQ